MKYSANEVLHEIQSYMCHYSLSSKNKSMDLLESKVIVTNHESLKGKHLAERPIQIIHFFEWQQSHLILAIYTFRHLIQADYARILLWVMKREMYSQEPSHPRKRI